MLDKSASRLSQHKDFVRAMKKEATILFNEKIV